MTQPPHDADPSSPDWSPPGEPDDRPPPYQGAYGEKPGYGPPAPGQQPPVAPGGPPAPGQTPAQGQPPYGQQPAYGHPGYAPPGPGQQGYGGQPAYGPPGYVDQKALYAGRWARLGAAVLDGLIIFVVSIPFLLQAIRWDRMADMAESGESMSDPADVYNIPRLLAGYAIAFVLGFAYYTVQHAKWGQTVGKRAAGIRVVRADDHLAVSWGQAAGRQAFVYGLAILSGLLNVVGAVGLLASVAGLLDNAWILWDERRQALHDKVAKTVVVKAGPWAPNPYARP